MFVGMLLFLSIIIVVPMVWLARSRREGRVLLSASLFNDAEVAPLGRGDRVALETRPPLRSASLLETPEGWTLSAATSHDPALLASTIDPALIAPGASVTLRPGHGAIIAVVSGASLGSAPALKTLLLAFVHELDEAEADLAFAARKNTSA